MTTTEWMDANAMTEQPRMPEIPGYPYESAPGYVPTQPAPVTPQPAVEPASETYSTPAYDVAHNYVVPTVTQTYYATADSYTQPSYETQPATHQAPPAQYQPVAPDPVVYPAPVQYEAPTQYVAPVEYAAQPVEPYVAAVQYEAPTQYVAPVEYAAPVAYSPTAAAAPQGLSRTEQRKRQEEQAKAANKKNSIFKAWWLYPLIAAIAVCGYLGWQSAQVPVSNAPTTPVVVDNQP